MAHAKPRRSRRVTIPFFAFFASSREQSESETLRPLFRESKRWHVGRVGTFRPQSATTVCCGLSPYRSCRESPLLPSAFCLLTCAPYFTPRAFLICLIVLVPSGPNPIIL